jgi:hypothetical protein
MTGWTRWVLLIRAGMMLSTKLFDEPFRQFDFCTPSSRLKSRSETPTGRIAQRLIGEGLDRHDAIHAIGPEQRERAFALVPRFMAWKLATGFVLTAETWLGPERTRSGEEAVLTIGVTRYDRMAVIRRIRHTPALSFGPPEWLAADALDETYFRLLPSEQRTLTAEEAAMLAAVFAEDGELPARPASGSQSSQSRRPRPH